ncbi:MAG: hypothetical protein J5719_04385, partial [Bacteroidales bacterium]|nr:hypothetical protein [Bacteroidales bacterium]
MKSNKVLLGLFVGFMALVGGSVDAQNRFYEIGPSNVGGQVSCLAIDQMDTNHTTIYAGATTGGLYIKSDNYETLQALYRTSGQDQSLSNNMTSWHYVPYFNGDTKDVLPVSAMVQGPAP